MFEVVEVDQWTSSGNLDEFTLADVKAGKAHVTGGDSEAVRRIGIASMKVILVKEDDLPSIGTAWFRSGKNGRLSLYKSNYDTSG